MKEGTPRTKAISVHKGDREQLDCLKGGIVVQDTFPRLLVDLCLLRVTSKWREKEQQIWCIEE